MFRQIQYRQTVPYSGDGKKCLETARAVLANNNFKIEFLSASELLASGPGMYATKQNPLLGATRVRIVIGESAIELAAELGGVRRMRNFLLVFPPALALLLSGVFLLVSLPPPAVAISWLAVLPWAALSPLMIRMIRSRTEQALRTLLHNMRMPDA